MYFYENVGRTFVLLHQRLFQNDHFDFIYCFLHIIISEVNVKIYRYKFLFICISFCVKKDDNKILKQNQHCFFKKYITS